MTALGERIARFYDDSSPLWLDMWGEHMHHGFYGPDGRRHVPHRRAQLDLISEVLRFADPGEPRRILDAGCGVGGSARALALRFGADVVGLTLSGVQVERGRAYNAAAGLADRVELLRHDLTDYHDARGFDFVWSVESAEHVPDKRALLARFYDLLRPGGTLAVVTWCHRETPPALTPDERGLLDAIGEHYHLPPWVSIGDYVAIAKSIGYVDGRAADWSPAVAPFWGGVIESALSWRGLTGLLRAGPQALWGAWAMQYMQRGFRRGLIRYGVLRMRKPE